VRWVHDAIGRLHMQIRPELVGEDFHWRDAAALAARLQEHLRAGRSLEGRAVLHYLDRGRSLELGSAARQVPTLWRYVDTLIGNYAQAAQCRSPEVVALGRRLLVNIFFTLEHAMEMLADLQAGHHFQFTEYMRNETLDSFDYSMVVSSCQAQQPR
jgi:hypothetical protein